MIDINLNGNVDNLTELLSSGQVEPWDFKNSQTFHELRHIQQMQRHLEQIKAQEAYQQKQQRQRREQQQQSQHKPTPHKTKKKTHKEKDDELEL